MSNQIMVFFQAFVFSFSFFYLCSPLPFKINKWLAFVPLFGVFYFVYSPASYTLMDSILRYVRFIVFYFTWAVLFVKIEKKYALFLSFFCTVLMGIWFSCFQILLLYLGISNRLLLVYLSGIARLVSVLIFRWKIIYIDENRTISFHELFISIFPAMTCFLGNLVNYTLFSSLADNTLGKISLGFLTVFFGISTLVVLAGTEVYFRSETYRKEAEEADKHLAMQYQLFLKEKEQDERLRSLHHDMKHHMEVLNQLTDIDEMKEYVKTLKKEAEQALDQIDTGNAVLNIILANKKRTCDELGIQLKTGIRFDHTDFLSSMDVCSLFVNCLDNAIEAVKNGNHQKTIEVAGGWINDTLVVRIQNDFTHDLKIDNGHLLSTKSESGHGYGIKNARAVVEKYGGTFNTKAEGHKFVVTWMIPKKDK